MENIVDEAVIAENKDRLSENERRQIMEEIVDGLSRTKDKLGDYLVDQDEGKRNLDAEVERNKQGESAEKLAKFVKAKFDKDSEIGLLTNEAESEAESEETVKLRQKLDDPKLKDEEKIALLEEAGSWYRLSGNTLEQMSDFLAKIRSKTSYFVEDLLENVPHEEYMRMMTIEETTGSYADESLRNTQKMQDELTSGHEMWNQKMKSLRG